MVTQIKNAFSWLQRLFSVPVNDTELMRAQFNAFLKQIPLLYFILATNTLAAVYTFAPLAPHWLSLYIPLTLCGLCALRFAWWFRTRHIILSDKGIIRQLQITNRLAAGLAAIFTVWGLSLYEYGDPYAKGQIAFYMALTSIGCIFCLMHLRSAALMVTLVVNIPFIVFFFFEGQPSLRAIAVNLALVSVAMITILMIYYRDFANLVESRKSLIAKQAETQRLSDENFRIANLDSLTDLPNRRRFFADLETAFKAAETSGDRFAIGVIDLDGFKPVNDTYGHTTGDKVLIEAGRRLLETCPENVLLARLGGDEFGLIVTGNPTPEDLMALGKRIGEIVRLPYTIGSTHALLACSLGFASFPDCASTTDGLFERADYALYYAKRNLRGQTVLFSAEHEAQIRAQSVIEQGLQSATLPDELTLVFQPIVDARTGRTLAFEALARWQSPTLGAVSPADFIPVAERAGLIRGITSTMLEKALMAATSWPEHIRISFNLSAHDVCAAEGVLQLIALINKSGIDPKRIDFEITETSVAYDFKQARQSIIALKAMGVGISLDDFGTGYSSLSHVHRLPLDKIKVDRSFVTDINTNAVSHKIVKSLTALCADMGLTCVIEGVETAEQLETLSELGCDIIQGYYFSKPLPEDQIAAYLSETSRARA